MKNTSHTNARYVLYVALLLIIITTGCKKTDKFYTELEDILQVAGEKFGYKSTYAVGDTIYFYGRFGTLDSDLRIRIGDADGQLLSRSYVEAIQNSYLDEVQHHKTLQLVKVLVDEKMGTGPDRQVRFTMGAQTVTGTPVYIRNGGTPAVFNDTLNLKQTGFDYDLSKHYFIQAWTGTGKVFYFNYMDNTLNVWQDSVSTILPVVFEDAVGLFTITTVYSAHVNRSERQLVFCASTKNISTGTSAQRLCRIDLSNLELTTLNLTAGSISGGPWEGPVGSVKLPIIRLMAVGESGRIYFHTGQLYRQYLTSAIGMVNEEGDVAYITGSLSGTTVSNAPIVFSNTGGVNTAGVAPTPVAFDPDKHLFYHLAYADSYAFFRHSILNVFDLSQRREVNTFAPEHADLGVQMILDAPFKAAKYDQCGPWFLQEGKPVFFLSDNYSRNDVGAAVVVDFEGRKTYTYAPSFIYQRQPSSGAMVDRIAMNYTPEGHVIFRRPYTSSEPQYPKSTLEITEIKN
ncbi:hypothetical protein [Chitinophaga barathri]|uniref:hypothetical protein n=1 Tax=Chitinophaga barathri TaxID=1647451 RepID=UPI000F4E621B|nr:hypothetical protein [Chitinophaga barathri]